MKSRLFYLFVLFAIILLITFSLSSIKRSNAIIASVESQKTAISFHKPVQIKDIHVSAGQHVKKGQLLLEVKRPDLVMEEVELLNDQQLIVSEKSRLLSDYDSKMNLMAIELKGKIQRLDANINSLEVEIKFRQAIYNDMISGSKPDTINTPLSQDSDQIKLASLITEKNLLISFKTSEKNRLKTLLAEDLESNKLRFRLVEQRLEALKIEQANLKQFAPFDGTIGTSNVQLMELIPPFQTIVSIYEERPSSIKAHLNLSSGYDLSVGQKVKVESASREYYTEGKIYEIGARIVPYQDPSQPVTARPLFGKEIFIKLPEENTFLYGEQVFIYISAD